MCSHFLNTFPSFLPLSWENLIFSRRHLPRHARLAAASVISTFKTWLVVVRARSLLFTPAAFFISIFIPFSNRIQECFLSYVIEAIFHSAGPSFAEESKARNVLEGSKSQLVRIGQENNARARCVMASARRRKKWKKEEEWRFRRRRRRRRQFKCNISSPVRQKSRARGLW